MSGAHVNEQQKETAVSIEEEIRLTAELIFYVLHHEGEMKLEILKEEVSHRVPYFAWGIGWLVGKGDIEIVENGDSYLVRRKGPVPVVIPLRGV